jgi:multisubunit Na+/H+ antiporter MnhE subunit
MALWVMIDDSLQFDELLAGAGAAAIAALGATLVTSQAAVRFRPGPLRPLAVEALKLPAGVARDTLTVFAALVRRRPPAGEFAEVPCPPGSRVLLTGVRSVAPNTFVVGIDSDKDTLLVHHLVPPPREKPREEW